MSGPRGMEASLARRMALDAAASLVGGQRALARLLEVSERSVRQWLGFDRRIADGVLVDAAAVLEQQAAACLDRAAAIRELVAAQRVEPLRVETVKAALPAGELAPDDLVAGVRRAQEPEA